MPKRFVVIQYEPCPSCKGTGETTTIVGYGQCATCVGSGEVKSEANLADVLENYFHVADIDAESNWKIRRDRRKLP